VAAALAGDVRDDARGDGVVAHGLHGVGLHQPHVLVGGGVENDGGSVLGEDLAHALPLLAVGQHGAQHRWLHVALVEQLALDFEEVVLGVIEQHELTAAPPTHHASDLAAELSADRAAGARHQHDGALQIGADAVELHLHGLAAEHVLDLHLAHLARQ
jgi:hypothetical protein